MINKCHLFVKSATQRKLAMQYTNTPAWEAASTAASTRPRRTEKKKEAK